MKRFISVLLTVCMLCSLVTMSFAGYKEDAKLRFRANGKFKILALADVQDSYPMEPAVIQFISEALDFTSPDLVVFLGDNIVGTDPKSIEQMITPLVERNVPFTFVFGNHDWDFNDPQKQRKPSVYHVWNYVSYFRKWRSKRNNRS